MRFRRRLKILLLRPARLHRGVGRRLVATLALLAFIGTAVGWPLPMPPTDKDRSQPFPCADRPCGCRTAEQCWRGCCCFTMSEKLAWAREHGVTPPTYVVEAAQQQQASNRKCERPGCKHCSHQNQAPAETDEIKSCCKPIPSSPSGRGWRRSRRVRGNLVTTPLPSTPSPRPSPRGRGGATDRSTTVIGVLAWRCQGGSLLWNSVGSCLPPPMSIAWSPECGRVEPLPTDDTFGLSVGRDPPVPPPKLGRWTL